MTPRLPCAALLVAAGLLLPAGAAHGARLTAGLSAENDHAPASTNGRQPFQKGFLKGGPLVNINIATKGKLPAGRLPWHRNDAKEMFIGKTKDGYPKADGKYTFDKLSSVFITGNATRDDAPNHIRVQQHVPREVAETWVWMCPAGVYEIPEDAPAEGDVDVIVNYTNCVQCGAITAKGGRLTTPEGGDGPLYTQT